jgi:hypothetical protein
VVKVPQSNAVVMNDENCFRTFIVLLAQPTSQRLRLVRLSACNVYSRVQAGGLAVPNVLQRLRLGVFGHEHDDQGQQQTDANEYCYQ